MDTEIPFSPPLVFPSYTLGPLGCWIKTARVARLELLRQIGCRLGVGTGDLSNGMQERKMKRLVRRIKADFYYLRKPLFDFLPLFGLLILILFLGSFSFHNLYRHEELTYVRSLYITYCLVFMEHLVRFPDHWFLQVFYFLLPPLGLIVILDGLVRFSCVVLRRDEHGAEWVRAMSKAYHDHVILCGLGRVGLRILQQLIELGEDVVVLEKDRNNPNMAFAKQHKVPVLSGSGREEGIFGDLNVAKAKSIICATDDDLANLEMALDARKLNPDTRVVVRLFDEELVAKVRESFDIDLAFSTASQVAPLFATCSSDSSIENSFYLGDKLLVVAHLVVNEDSELIGKTIHDIRNEHPVLLLAHTRHGQKAYFPSSDTIFHPGDCVTVQTEPKTLRLLHEWNRDPKPY